MNTLIQMTNKREKIVVFLAKSIIFGIVGAIVVACGTIIVIGSAILIANH